MANPTQAKLGELLGNLLGSFLMVGQAFGDAETGGTRTRVPGDFLGAGSESFADEETKITLWIRPRTGPFRTVEQRSAVFSKILFHEPIFEAVERQHSDPTTRF
jgi:hypothetical protein